MRALVTGATGFVGKQLLKRLPGAVVLSRNPDRAQQTLRNYSVDQVQQWNPTTEQPPTAAFDRVDAVFHLAGESVADGRWTSTQKQRIRDSRELGTRNLVERLVSLQNKPNVLVSASAVGYYGSRGDELLDESAPPGNDYLADVCVAWEREASNAARSGIRVVTPRIGVVLGSGGALPKMLPPFKAGIGGRLGTGRQWMPWIHVDDLVGLLLHAAERHEISGAMNAVAPTAVTNLEFTKALGRVLHRPTIFPVPYLGLRVLFGEFAKVLFASQKVVPRVALDTGYVFRYQHVEDALRAILKSGLDSEPAQRTTEAKREGAA